MEKVIKFAELGLSEESLLAISKKGFEEPSPIQKLTIPLLLENEKDILGQAQTGTGKTAAFGLPVMDQIEEGTGKIQALILTPTRELAVQVAEEMSTFRGGRKIGVLPIYGGQSFDQQLRRLDKGIEVVVATPGRMIDHLNRKTISLNDLKFIVLDEADEMLNMGFIEEVETILAKTPPEKRFLLFSATMPGRIREMAEKFMGDYESVKVKSEQLTVDLTDQIYFEVRASDKFEALCRIIDVEKEFYALIFCRTRLKVSHLAEALQDRGWDAEALHGEISQSQREKILDKFKKRKIQILVATDVAARGIDINDLTHVLNYSIPRDPESYVHRIGRTGRAGKQGTAITFITPSEYSKLMRIQKIAKSEIRKETLPKIKDLIRIKRKRIVNEIKDVIGMDNYHDNMEIAQDLLQDYEPDQIISALLTHAYKDEFSSDRYMEIIDPKKEKRITKKRGKSSPDQEGITRLFIALGKKDKINPRSLVDMIREEAMIEPNRIRDVQVYDKFSFANVPFQDAEDIIQAFRGKGRDRKPLIVEAKGKTESSKGRFEHSKSKPRTRRKKRRK